MKILPKIKELRLQHNYSEEYVAELLGMPVAMYKTIENENSGIIWITQVEQLAKLYNTRMSYILEINL